jgi:hypothetical protein
MVAWAAWRDASAEAVVVLVVVLGSPALLSLSAD